MASTKALITTKNPKLPSNPLRKPLQPRNFLTNPTINHLENKTKQKWIEISLVKESSKENSLFFPTHSRNMEALDSSLAEELNAVRRKMERMRLEKKKTEKLLEERDLFLDREMKKIDQRWEVQKMLEIEVEKLTMFKELKSSCMGVEPVQSLRESEREKKMKESQMLVSGSSHS